MITELKPNEAPNSHPRRIAKDLATKEEGAKIEDLTAARKSPPFCLATTVREDLDQLASTLILTKGEEGGHHLTAASSREPETGRATPK
ncbi:hypothetical protein ACFX12_041493 [Malus domestica]